MKPFSYTFCQIVSTKVNTNIAKLKESPHSKRGNFFCIFQNVQSIKFFFSTFHPQWATHLYINMSKMCSSNTSSQGNSIFSWCTIRYIYLCIQTQGLRYVYVVDSMGKCQTRMSCIIQCSVWVYGLTLSKKIKQTRKRHAHWAVLNEWTNASTMMYLRIHFTFSMQAHWTPPPPPIWTNRDGF